jgi:O-phospho-L-seryl-tRNASec:L-selenocysteinyl-tRNA synthase
MALGLAASVARDVTKKNVIVYPRVDHQSPMKGLHLVGLHVRMIESIVSGDAVNTPIENIRNAVDLKTAAIMSTTSFFPPREPDDIKAIARLAEEKEVFHIINNAYGVQSEKTMKLIQGAIDAGRVDLIVQSTDKNFLTPIGGAIVASPTPELIDMVAQAYPGRASAAPIVQFLSAILSLGINGYKKLRTEQVNNRQYLEKILTELATSHDERLLNVYNPIAVAMTLNNHKAKQVGAHMYTQRVTGPRVLGKTDFGTCCRRYHSPYITINAAIGSRKEDIQSTIRLLDKTLNRTKR